MIVTCSLTVKKVTGERRQSNPSRFLLHAAFLIMFVSLVVTWIALFLIALRRRIVSSGLASDRTGKMR